MIIALAMLIVITALYAVLLEIRIKKLETELKRQIKINGIFDRMIDILYDEIGVLAEVTGIKEKGE